MSKESQIGNKEDYNGRNSIDPTKNVLDLVDAAIKRIDDLNEENRRTLDARFARIDSLREQNKEYQINVVNLLTNHIQDLSLAEAKRIDAIRAVDVAAVAVASERATQQATVLANQVSASAETLRSLVASTATQVATQLQTIATQLTDRIAALEKSSYTGAGRAGISDPILTESLQDVKLLLKNQAQGTGKNEGASSLWGFIAGGIGLLFGLAGIIFAIIRLSIGQ